MVIMSPIVWLLAGSSLLSSEGAELQALEKQNGMPVSTVLPAFLLFSSSEMIHRFYSKSTFRRASDEMYASEKLGLGMKTLAFRCSEGVGVRICLEWSLNLWMNSYFVFSDMLRKISLFVPQTRMRSSHSDETDGRRMRLIGQTAWISSFKTFLKRRARLWIVIKCSFQMQDIWNVLRWRKFQRTDKSSAGWGRQGK